jgi:hypothetical protein
MAKLSFSERRKSAEASPLAKLLLPGYYSLNGSEIAQE